MGTRHSTSTQVLSVAEWRQAIQHARMRIESQRQDLEARLLELQEEQRRLDAEEELMEQAVRTFKARTEDPFNGTPLPGSNLREVLIINFADGDGIIYGKAAARFLTDVGYFASRDSADGAIYTILNRSPFVKVSKGVYRIPLGSAEWRRLRDPAKGLSQAHADPPPTNGPSEQFDHSRVESRNC